MDQVETRGGTPNPPRQKPGQKACDSQDVSVASTDVASASKIEICELPNVSRRKATSADAGGRWGGCNSLLHSCLGPHRPERSISNSHCNRRMPAGRSSRLPTGRLGQVPHINRCTNRDRWEPRARARSFPRLARPLASPRRVLEGGSADPRPQSARPATGSRTTRLRAHESHSA